MQPLLQAAQMLRENSITHLAEEPMARHTTFRIGGPAAIFCMPTVVGQLVEAIKIAQECDIPHIVLGKGSNVLFCDKGYRGMVVHLGQGFDAVAVKGNAITAGAGAELTKVCDTSETARLAGLEFAYGIPGSVGGAVYMNAGAFGGEVRGVLQSVQCLCEDLAVRTLPVETLELGYRESVFHTNPWVVLEATFLLQAGQPEEIHRKMRQHLAHRKEKQPLEYPSAGSAFKRPAGAFAGALIEQCGLRGHRVGGAAISEKHCGFIVNLGGATCSDVLRLADEVAETVLRQTGFVLEKEIRVVGHGR
ncbi:UDP-N-acetylmuramate dehydrogenase [Ruminococcaceae bacterium OttesenSCG-928-O06]|nr:UDP-N-acetylmuramate dehydrogenase [Ruminococcaceae bacterium OttesenSCG-928-O06]